MRNHNEHRVDVNLVAVILTAVGLLVSGLQAQTPVPQTTEPIPEFEVATVKINKSGQVQTQFGGVGGRISIVNMQLRGVIQAAYRVPANQLVNVPSWVNGTRVDIIAKADPSYSVQQLQTMLQPLLVERFKFAFHREMRDMDVYTLVLANADGRLGPKLKRSTTDCAVLGAAPRNTLQAPAPGERPACGLTPAGPGRIVASGFGMGPFSQILGLATRGRQVVDQTGLTGGFDIDLTYTPEAFGAGAAAQSAPAPQTDAEANGPSLVTALQEQLGLKLEGKKLPLEVMVVDRIEPPTED